MENTFVASAALSEIKAIGIVDDVLTTGATIREICKEITRLMKPSKSLFLRWV